MITFVLTEEMLILIVYGFVQIAVDHDWKAFGQQPADAYGWIAVVMTVIGMLLLQPLRLQMR